MGKHSVHYFKWGRAPEASTHWSAASMCSTGFAKVSNIVCNSCPSSRHPLFFPSPVTSLEKEQHLGSSSGTALPLTTAGVQKVFSSLFVMSLVSTLNTPLPAPKSGSSSSPVNSVNPDWTRTFFHFCQFTQLSLSLNKLKPFRSLQNQ